MPLPIVAEAAAEAVERIAAKLDRDIARYLQDGGRLPTLTALTAAIYPHVQKATIAAVKEVTDAPTSRQIDAATAATMAPIVAAMSVALTRARRSRKRVPRRQPVDDGAPVSTLRNTRAAGAVFAVLIARRTRRARTPQMVAQVARQAGLTPPRPVAGYAKMVVRTEVARARNTVAVEVAKKLGLVLYVRDGRNGPTDHECERVNGRYATLAWGARHKLEHPNCTRLLLPRRLPSSQRVTLIR
jgi:hypothetical protein